MPILCLYANQLYLCGASDKPEWAGKVSLISSRFGPFATGLTWKHEVFRSYASADLRSLGGILFFPEVRVNGVKVTPLSWSSRHDEPRVSCVVEAPDMDWVKWFGREPTDAWDRVALMESAGWSWDVKDDMGHRACRLKEFELIEGPPPEGAF